MQPQPATYSFRFWFSSPGSVSQFSQSQSLRYAPTSRTYTTAVLLTDSTLSNDVRLVACRQALKKARYAGLQYWKYLVRDSFITEM